jgi:hypothetical protein
MAYERAGGHMKKIHSALETFRVFLKVLGEAIKIICEFVKSVAFSVGETVGFVWLVWHLVRPH